MLDNLRSHQIMEPPDTLIRASVQGVVYLIHSQTGAVYTYNVDSLSASGKGLSQLTFGQLGGTPTYIGQLERIPEEDKHLMSKQNGCLHYAKVKYREDIKEVMATLRQQTMVQM